MNIYLDMDGVVADFTAGLCRAFGIPFTNYPYSMPHGLWDYVEYVEQRHGVTWDQVKQVVGTSDFWAKLPELPGALTLFAKLQKYDLHFLTTPTGDPMAVFDGKREWLEDRDWAAPHDGSMILLEKGETKEQYARPDSVLLDDQDMNVQEFRHGGGRAILVPRPWNNRHRECMDMFADTAFKRANDLVLEELEEMSQCQES